MRQSSLAGRGSLPLPALINCSSESSSWPENGSSGANVNGSDSTRTTVRAGGGTGQSRLAGVVGRVLALLPNNGESRARQYPVVDG